MEHDVFLLLSYGSPEFRADIHPFLENVFGGKTVPHHVLKKTVMEYEKLAEQSGQFSPLPQQCRVLLSEIFCYAHDRGLTDRLGKVYWGNLFWHPFLRDTILEMQENGVKKAVAFLTSPFDSEVSRKRYLNEIEKIRNEIGPDAPQIDVLPPFGTHPLYLRAVADRILESAALLSLDYGGIPLEDIGVQIIFTAHSLPLSDSQAEQYRSQIHEAAAGVISLMQGPTGENLDWELAFQSRGRSGSDAWLEPNLSDRIKEIAEERKNTGLPHEVLIVPIGFLLENKETAYDLDIKLMELCEELQISAVRVAVAGTNPSVIRMICSDATGNATDSPDKYTRNGNKLVVLE